MTKNAAIKCGKVVTVVILLVQIVTLLNICRYTFFTADDYWHAVTAGGVQNSILELWSASWDFMKARFYGWQGTYFSMFLQIFLCPLNWKIADPYRLLHIILILVCFLFFLSLYLLVRSFAGRRGYSSKWGILCGYTIFVTALLNTHFYYENFFWFSGVTSYTIPLIQAFLAGAVLLKSDVRENVEGKREQFLVAGASILLFLACGGSLEIALPICYVLLVRVGSRIRCRMISCSVVIPFLAAVIGTLINGAAPGNYARHAVTAEDSGMIRTLWHACRDTLFQYFDESGRLFDTSVLGVMFFAALLLGSLAGYRISSEAVRRNAILTVIMIPLPLIGIFAVVLGYGTVGLPERTYLMIHLSFLAVFLNLAFCAGTLLSRIWEDRKKLCTILTLMMIVVTMTDHVCLYRTYEGDRVEQAPMSVLMMDWQKGWTDQYYQDVVSFYESIENSKEMKVTADAGNLLNAPQGLMPLIILDADSLAKYYGKTSVTVISDNASEIGE